MESILTSVKKILGIAENYEHFDQDLIIHINSVFTILFQMGVGPERNKSFFITDKTDKWSDFLQSEENINLVKTYVGLKVKTIFDPPSSSALIESINRHLGELEWRLQNHKDL